MIVLCGYCDKPALLVSGEEVYPRRKDLHHLKFWMCEPCEAWVGCHVNSGCQPLGILANKDLRKAKSAAHSLFDPIWKDGIMSRKGAYRWLAESLNISSDKCHIGMFDEEMCGKVCEVCEDFFYHLREKVN